MNSASASTSDAKPVKASEPVIHRKYFPYIDGLRCLAVIPVVLYHLCSPICPGGFVGVDIFFVISGYLIYGGILEDLRQGKFSMVTFYHRRIRRIFPAYLALVVCTLLAGIAIYYWSRIVPLAQTALFSSFFSTNLYFWIVTGYFQPTANENPLLHLWTLGVEEQFYIVIPLMTLALWKFNRTSLKPVLFVILLFSLGLCIELDRTNNTTTAFYLLPSRAWELMAGALLAYLPRAQKSFGTYLLSVLGLVLVLLSFWCLRSELGVGVEVTLPFIGSLGVYPFPGFTTIPVIIGSLLLLYYGESGPIGGTLSSSPFTFIGKISYSLYLWHWPIIVFVRYIQYDRQSPLTLVMVFLASLVIAYLSWKWVEMPFRVSKEFTPRAAFNFVGWGCALLACFCLLLFYTDGLRTFIHTRANIYASPPRPFSKSLKKLVPTHPFNPPPYPLLDKNYVEVIGQQGQKPTFCLLGDSHAEALEPGLDRVAAEHHQTGLFINRKLIPLVDESNHDSSEKLIEWAGSNPDIRDVYLVGRWPMEYRIQEGMRNLGESGSLKPNTLEPKMMQDMTEGFRRTAQWFVHHGKRVFVFTCVPEYGYFPADMTARSQSFPLADPIVTYREDYVLRQRPFTEVFNALENEGLITVVPLETGFVSGDKFVYMSPQGQTYYQDSDHLTPAGAYVASEAIARFLWPTEEAH